MGSIQELVREVGGFFLLRTISTDSFCSIVVRYSEIEQEVEDMDLKLQKKSRCFINFLSATEKAAALEAAPDDTGGKYEDTKLCYAGDDGTAAGGGGDNSTRLRAYGRTSLVTGKRPPHVRNVSSQLRFESNDHGNWKYCGAVQFRGGRNVFLA